MHLQSAEGSGTDGADSLALSHAELSRAEQSLERSFDPRYGGFGSAPKFPHVMDIELLMRRQPRNPTTRAICRHGEDRSVLAIRRFRTGDICSRGPTRLTIP